MQPATTWDLKIWRSTSRQDWWTLGYQSHQDKSWVGEWYSIRRMGNGTHHSTPNFSWNGNTEKKTSQHIPTVGWTNRVWSSGYPFQPVSWKIVSGYMMWQPLVFGPMLWCNPFLDKTMWAVPILWYARLSGLASLLVNPESKGMYWGGTWSKSRNGCKHYLGWWFGTFFPIYSEH